MAEPIGVASGLLSIAVVAFQSSKKLYELVNSFQSNQRSIRELRQELEALNGVLQSLHQTLSTSDYDLSALQLPLSQCGRACAEFEKVIVECTAHSGGSRTSFRDWTKLRYMDNDITGFKNMLAGYKSTIAIALGDANLRTATVTIEVLNDYRNMIRDTSTDLEERLQEINLKLSTLMSYENGTSEGDDATRRQMENEKASIQQCLTICSQVSEHFKDIQSTHFQDIVTGADDGQAFTTSSSRQLTSGVLGNFHSGLRPLQLHLQSQLDGLNKRLADLAQRRGVPGYSETGFQDAQKEVQSIQKCLDICAEANDRVNTFEDVSTSDDSHQTIVSTFGDLISAKRIIAGVRSRQVLGQMSDASLQQLSKDHFMTFNVKDGRSEDKSGTQFEGRHGVGRKLDDLR